MIYCRSSYQNVDYSSGERPEFEFLHFIQTVGFSCPIFDLSQKLVNGHSLGGRVYFCVISKMHQRAGFHSSCILAPEVEPLILQFSALNYQRVVFCSFGPVLLDENICNGIEQAVSVVLHGTKVLLEWFFTIMVDHPIERILEIDRLVGIFIPGRVFWYYEISKSQGLHGGSLNLNSVSLGALNQ